MPDLTSIIPGNPYLVSSTNQQTIIAIQKLAIEFSQYVKFYWLRHNIECDINLSEFPANIKLKYTKLSPDKKLNSYQLQKFSDMQRVFTGYPQESTFYLERSEGEIEHRIIEAKRFFEILLNLLKYQESDYLTLFNKFVSDVGENKIKGELFAPTPIAKSSTISEYLKQGVTSVLSTTGLANSCTLERMFNIFKCETELTADKRDYFNTIILPINTNQFFTEETKTMPDNNNTKVKSPVTVADTSVTSSSADTHPEAPKSLMAKTKERLSNLLSSNPVHLSMPGLTTCLALTSVATLTAAGVYAYRSGYRAEGLFNLFKRSDAGSSTAQTVAVVAQTAAEVSKPVVQAVAQTVRDVATPVANVVAETAKEAAKPVAKAVVPRPACR